MKESDREDLASSSGLEPYAGDGNIVGVASVRGDAGQPLSSDIIHFVCRPCFDKGKATSRLSHGEIASDTGGVEDPEHVSKSKCENREILLVCVEETGVACQETERSENVSDGEGAIHKGGDPRPFRCSSLWRQCKSLAGSKRRLYPY